MHDVAPRARNDDHVTARQFLLLLTERGLERCLPRALLVRRRKSAAHRPQRELHAFDLVRDDRHGTALAYEMTALDRARELLARARIGRLGRITRRQTALVLVVRRRLGARRCERVLLLGFELAMRGRDLVVRHARI